MPYQASQIMLYAAALHCAFAIAMLGNPCTFPSTELGGSLGSMSAQARASSSSNSNSAVFYDWIGSRVSVESTWMLFAMLLLLVGLWWIWTFLWVLGSTFGEFFKCILLTCCPNRMKEQTLDDDVADTMDWTQASMIIQKACPPASYKLDENPDLKHLAQFLRDTETGVVIADGADHLGDASRQGFDQPAAIEVDTPAVPASEPVEANRGWTPASVSSDEPQSSQPDGTSAQTASAADADLATAAQSAPSATAADGDATSGADITTISDQADDKAVAEE